jgi:CheY-like chemotaxis protein
MDDTFVKELRKVLNHLYDPDFLITSPLSEALGITGSYDRAIRLQRQIEQSIQSLKPANKQSIHSKQWQIYTFLTYRFLQQFSQQEVARQMDISQTQLYRIQQAALTTLAVYIWDRYDLSHQWASSDQNGAKDAGSITSNAGGITSEAAVQMEWLLAPSADRISDIRQTVHDVIDLIQPIQGDKTHLINFQLADDLPLVAIHPIALRQILINLLYSISQSPHAAETAVTVRRNAEMVEICIDMCLSGGDGWRQAIEEPVKIASELTRQANGIFQRSDAENKSEILVALPIMEGIPILVVEDNEEHIHLLERLVTGSTYRIYATSDPQNAIRSAEKISPKAIILDIMMPELDGWAIIQKIRNHPVLYKVPVIISSILPVQSLAASLSADGFLPKPVKKETLLALLARLIFSQETK